MCTYVQTDLAVLKHRCKETKSGQSVPMLDVDKYLLSLRKRMLIPVVCALGLLAWLILCHAHYQSYWFGTIYRVQTTDFNLLHHTLPLTLSEYIQSGRDDLVQKVLDANFGLFGLVVTDPSGNAVLYKTNKVYNNRQSWQHKANPEILTRENEPYDVLTDPPQLEPMYEHVSPRADKATQVTGIPKGRILGRLYYLRADAPTFFEDICRFALTGFWEMSGAKRGYLFITMSIIGFCLVAVLLVWLRRRGLELKQKELENIQRELDIRKRALEHLSAELTTQKTRKAWLEKEADQAYRRALGLKQGLERLRDSLKGAQPQQQPAPYTNQAGVKVRPPVHPPSALLEEIEGLIPELTDNAKTLKSQAGLLHDYCAILEQRQAEMKKIVDNAAFAGDNDINLKAPTQYPSLPENLFDMSPPR